MGTRALFSTKIIPPVFTGGGGGSSPLSLDAPVNSSNTAYIGDSFGFDRLVDGFSGNTVRLKRLSDNAESDFGFSSGTGYFNYSAVDAWRGGANVDLVRFYDQKGSATWTTSGTVAFIRSNVPYRFGCDRDDATDLLTRSATNGALGVLFTGGSYATITGTSVSASTGGFEMIMLHQMNTRKAKVPANDTVSSNNTTERILTYGTGTDNYFRHEFNSTFGTFETFITKPTGASQTDIGGSLDFYQQYGQTMLRMRFNSSEYQTTVNGGEDAYKTISAASTADIALGSMDNGTVVIGAGFSNTTGGISATAPGNFLFGAIIIGTTQPQLQSFLTQSKLGLVGQQHLNTSLDDLNAIWDEVVLFKDTNAGTGVTAGQNGNLTLQWNAGTNYRGATTNDFDYDDPITGLNGVLTPNDSNAANGYKATTTYGAGIPTFSVFAFHVPNLTSNFLGYPVSFDDSDGYTSSSNCAFRIGRDHSSASFWTQVQLARDPSGITGTRKDEFGIEVGDSRAGASQWQQAYCKYNRNTCHALAAWGRTFDSYTWEEISWANEDPSAPYEWDAPVRRASPQNLSYVNYNARPIFQIGTAEAPSGYNRADDATIRDPLMLQAVNRSYITTLGTASGHVVGDIARNDNASVSDSTNTATFVSSHFQAPYAGVTLGVGYKAGEAITATQAQITQVNAYKWFA